MQADVFFVLGLLFLGLAVPSFLSAYSESRAPRVAVIFLAVGIGALVWAHRLNPQGVSIDAVPGAIIRVIGYMVN